MSIIRSAKGAQLRPSNSDPDEVISEVAKPRGNGRKTAAASTIEALMFCLRERGTAALKEPTVLRRISELSEPQMHEVCARLQKLKPEIARAWPVNEVEKLVNTWAVYHER